MKTYFHEVFSEVAELQFDACLTNIQYIRAWEHPGASGIVDRIVKVLD